MRVVAKRTLRDFWEVHNDAEDQLKTWYREASTAKWNSPPEVKAEYPKASILKNGRIVFGICGNKYRLVVDVNYLRHWVFIRFIGTHSEYDEIDVNSI